MAVTTSKKGTVRRKTQNKTDNHILKIKTYQLNRLVEVVIMDKHPIFNHTLEGLPIHIAGKWDGVLLNTSRHQSLEKSGIEVLHVRERRLPLVKGVPTINDLSGSLWTRSQCVHQRMDPLLRQNVRTMH